MLSIKNFPNAFKDMEKRIIPAQDYVLTFHLESRRWSRRPRQGDFHGIIPATEIASSSHAYSRQWLSLSHRVHAVERGKILYNIIKRKGDSISPRCA